MRSNDQQRASMWTTLSPEDTVPADHPLRPIRKMVNEVLASLSPAFSKLYSKRGRPSIAPEKLLRAVLLQAFFSIRSETLLVEQLRYNMLFRWFVGLGMDDTIWDVSTFSKNRERFLSGEISDKFFCAVVKIARDNNLASDDHFTVDGTLLQAWASHKSFNPRTTMVARRLPDEIPKSILLVRNAKTIRTGQQRIPTHVSIRRAATRHRCLAISRMR